MMGRSPSIAEGRGSWRADIIGPPGLITTVGGAVVVGGDGGGVYRVLLATTASLVQDAQPPQKKGTPSDTVTVHRSGAVVTAAV